MNDTPGKTPTTVYGMLMVMTAAAIFAIMDTLSKYLTRFYPILFVAWARYAFHLTVVVLALGPRFGSALARTSRLGAQLGRGLLLAIASSALIGAVKYMPLAESSAIAFLGPLLVTTLSVFFLKEKVEPARWLAVVFGFIGVLTIIRPGGSVFTGAVLFPFGESICLRFLPDPYTSTDRTRKSLYVYLLFRFGRHGNTHSDATVFLGFSKNRSAHRTLYDQRPAGRPWPSDFSKGL